jgi:hypothetical protein
VTGTVENRDDVKRVMSVPYKRPGADEELDAEIAALEAERSGAAKEAEESEPEQKPAKDNEDENWKTRYGDLRRHSQKIENEQKAEIERLKKLAEQKATEAIRPPATDEELQAWMEEYPQVARIVETIAERKARELDGTYAEKLTKLEKVEYDYNRTKAEKALAKKHPDFEDIRNDKRWYEWLSTKSKKVQDTIYEAGAGIEDIADVIDMFKVQTKWGKDDKGSKRSGPEAVADTRSGGGIKPGDGRTVRYSDAMVAKMSDAEYAKHEAAINEARRTGNYDYDKSAAVA